MYTHISDVFFPPAILRDAYVEIQEGMEAQE
jgi:hypothetical protein